ncbi:hypothetical protein ANAEL_03702 [Anaerolineales bacterium]|nr:hypothetical protein ANAEL_03702 [Anaerolineales bacterium]
MRKVDPTDLCRSLTDEISELRQFYLDTTIAINAKARTDRQLSLLSELVFHQSYVMFESFISAWFIGCINRDASQFLRFRENTVRQSVKDKFDTRDETWLSYSPPKHPRVNDLARLLDKEEKNVTFKDYAAMEQRAKDWLTNAWSSKVSGITLDQRAIIDAAKVIRNCIAHRSQSSFKEMNDVLQNLPTTGASAFLRRDVNAVKVVGAYLKSLRQEKTRVEIFLDEFTQLANALK